jgi:hypothetical protein
VAVDRARAASFRAAGDGTAVKFSVGQEGQG